MSKVYSVCKDWDFVSRVTEISVGRFLIGYFTPLTLERQHQSALSDEDVTDVWAAAKLEAIRKVRKMKGGVKEQNHLIQTRRKWKRPSVSTDPMVGWSTRKGNTLSCSNLSAHRILQRHITAT